MQKRISDRSKKSIENGPAPKQFNLELQGVLAERIEVTEVSLRLPEKLSFDKWRAFAPVFRRENVRSQSVHWLLADWLAYGGDKFCTRGEDGRFKITPAFSRYAQVAEQTGYDETTLRTWAVIARAVPAGMRRPPDRLSFKHHRVVAVLEADEDKEHWLAEAERQQLSVSELTMAIRASLAAEDRQETLGLVVGDIGFVSVVAEIERKFNRLLDGAGTWPEARRRLLRDDVVKLRDRTNDLCARALEALVLPPHPTPA